MIQNNKHRFGVRSLCAVLGEPRSSWYRAGKPRAPRSSLRRSPRRLTSQEEQRVLDTLNSERFRDMAPAEAHATVLDEGEYLCSERTMYRILARQAQTTIRRQSPPRHHPRPELLATRSNELWSWDITKLKGPAKWTYYYLYKILDVFSRYAVGWMAAFKESAALAEDLIADTCLKQEIVPGALTLHADHGSSMTSLTVGQLLADLGVTKTHSRPHVSNDNPFSEAAFKTLKYRPDFPERFLSIEEARAYCREFFSWYNTQHHHCGIALLTPEQVHYGRHQDVLKGRSDTPAAAFLQHPERFVRGIPSVKNVPSEVWINKPTVKEQQSVLTVS